MNIALVVEHFDSLHPSGRSAHQVASGLTARGHEVTLITGSCHNADDWPGIDIAALEDKPSKWPWRLARFLRFARRQLDHNAFDLSLSMTPMVAADLVMALHGTLAERLQRISASHTSAPLAPHIRQAYRRRQETRALGDPRLRGCIVPGAYVRDQLCRHHGMDEDRITIIQFDSAIDQPEADLRQTWRRRVRQAYHIPDHTRVYFMPESHLAIHGLATLMAAAGYLQDQQLDHVILLAGGVGFRIYRTLASAGLARGFRVVGHTNHRAALYAAADVSVFPTWYDPAGQAVIDSLAMGVPAITTAYCGAAEMIPQHTPTLGRVLDTPGDSQALAQAMTDLATPTAHAIEPLDIEPMIDQLEQTITSHIA